MHQIFIGAEGQLGIVTGVKMSAMIRPTTTQVMMLGTSR